MSDPAMNGWMVIADAGWITATGQDAYLQVEMIGDSKRTLYQLLYSINGRTEWQWITSDRQEAMDRFYSEREQRMNRGPGAVR